MLRTFIYDPLVEWQRTKGKDSLAEASKTGEVTNEEVCPCRNILFFFQDYHQSVWKLWRDKFWYDAQQFEVFITKGKEIRRFTQNFSYHADLHYL